MPVLSARVSSRLPMMTSAWNQRGKAAKPMRPACLSAPPPMPAVDSSAPGTGHRHFPQDLGQQFATNEPPRSKEGFECRTTAECYAEFAYQVHVAIPLHLDDTEPAGLSAQHVPDAGPATGHRRRPEAVDTEARIHPPSLPTPAYPKDLKRELLARHLILLA